MLLNNEIKITVTNDGENNNLSLSLNTKDTFNEVMTCIEIAKENLTDALGEYLKSKGGITEKKFDKLIKTLTLEEIYENKI